MYTYEYVAQALKEIVYDKGDDYVYPTVGGLCYYYDPHTKEPSCLVGHFFAREEIIDGEVDDLDETNVDAVLSYLAETEAAHFDKGAHKLLSQVQIAQDGGIPWGTAVDSAVKKISWEL